MITAGIRFTPIKALSAGAITYYVPDTWNIFYTEGNYAWPLTDKLGLKLQAQFTEQGSVGGDNLIGSFHTRVGGAQASLSYNNAVLRVAFSITANSRNINSPYGTYPGYLSLIEKDFNRAGEKAWLLGFSYDFKDYVKGLSVTLNFARGTDAVDPAARSGLPDENEYDMTIDYRIEKDPYAACGSGCATPTWISVAAEAAATMSDSSLITRSRFSEQEQCGATVADWP
jgi:hypothetical protein